MTPAQWRILTALDEGGVIHLKQCWREPDKITLIKKDGTEQKLQTNTLPTFLKNRWVYGSGYRGIIAFYKLSAHGKESLYAINHPTGKYRGTYICKKCKYEFEHKGKSNTPLHCRRCGGQNCLKLK